MAQTSRCGLVGSPNNDRQMWAPLSPAAPCPFHTETSATWPEALGKREILLGVSGGKVPGQVAQLWNRNLEAVETPSWERFKCTLMQPWAAWFNLDGGSALSKCWMRELPDTPSSLCVFVVLWLGDFWLPMAGLSLIPCPRLSFRGKRFLSLLQSYVQPFLRKMPVFGHFAFVCLHLFVYGESLKFSSLGVLLFCLAYRISRVLLETCLADCWVKPLFSTDHFPWIILLKDRKNCWHCWVFHHLPCGEGGSMDLLQHMHLVWDLL